MQECEPELKTRGVLFELYGTLIIYGDMEKAWNSWYEVIYGAFRDSGLPLSADQFRPHCVGFFERPEPSGEAAERSVVERRLQRLAKEVQVHFPQELALQAIEIACGVGLGLIAIAREGISFAMLRRMHDDEESAENALEGVEELLEDLEEGEYGAARESASVSR